MRCIWKSGLLALTVLGSPATAQDIGAKLKWLWPSGLIEDIRGVLRTESVDLTDLAKAQLITKPDDLIDGIIPARLANIDGSGCSAFAVGPKHMITAAHCLRADTGRWEEDLKLKVPPMPFGSYDAPYAGATIQKICVIFEGPRDPKHAWSHDIGIVVLENEVFQDFALLRPVSHVASGPSLEPIWQLHGHVPDKNVFEVIQSHMQLTGIEFDEWYLYRQANRSLSPQEGSTDTRLCLDASVLGGSSGSILTQMSGQEAAVSCVHSADRSIGSCARTLNYTYGGGLCAPITEDIWPILNAAIADVFHPDLACHDVGD